MIRMDNGRSARLTEVEIGVNGGNLSEMEGAGNGGKNHFYIGR